MSTYRLDKLFAPRSVAVVGASPRATSPGRAVLSNLRAAAFAGPIHLVNPHYAEIEGIKAVKTIRTCRRTRSGRHRGTAAVVPGIVTAAGEKGAAAAIIITAGLGHGPARWPKRCESAARATGLRLVGPNCLGVLSSRVKLNASFAARMPPSRRSRFDVAVRRHRRGPGRMGGGARFGFSAVVSLGDKIDVDFGDLLDYFALDARHRAILLYVESIKDARKFMSAARAAARIKPVVVVKSGRHAQGAKAAQTHTGALAGSDAVYDAAFRRAGLLRVLDLDELFAAAETLGRVRPFPGKRLAILTNGGGIGVLAVDRLVDLGGTLAGISPRQRCEARCGAAADLVESQSRRHRRRCRCRTLRRRARGAHRGSRERRHPGHERADRACFAAEPRKIGRRRRAGAPQQRDPAEARFCGLGRDTSDAVTPIFEAAGIPQLRDRIRCGPGLYAPGALSGGAWTT